MICCLDYILFDGMNRTPIKSIQITEDRSLFAHKMADIGEKVAPCEAVYSLEEV
jgi:carbamoylphosphate synthase large subunit